MLFDNYVQLWTVALRAVAAFDGLTMNSAVCDAPWSCNFAVHHTYAAELHRKKLK